jgi:hypothetical protein
MCRWSLLLVTFEIALLVSYSPSSARIVWSQTVKLSSSVLDQEMSRELSAEGKHPE